MTSCRRGRPAAGLVVGLLVLLLAVAGCSASADDGAAEPKRLPDVTLQPLGAGDPVDLSTLRGPLVINLWASWCAPCRDELPEYQAFAEKYAGRVDVLGVDWQETREDDALSLAKETGLTYPLVSDPDGRLRTQVLPKLILVDETGVVALEKYVKISSVAQLEKLVETHLEVGG